MKKLITLGFLIVAASTVKADPTVSIVSHSTFTVQRATISVPLGRIDTLYTTSVLPSSGGITMTISSATIGDLGVGLLQATNTFVNVKARPFYAKGDGTTSDLNAIQNAINFVNGNGGGIVYFPAGVYITTAAIIAKSTVTLQGAGKYSSFLSLPQSNINPMNYSMIENSGNLSKFGIRDMGLQGNRALQTTSFTNGANDGFAVGFINAGKMNDIWFDNLYVLEFGATGAAKNTGGGGILIVPTGADTRCTNIYMLNSVFGNNDKVSGFYFDPSEGTIAGGRNVFVLNNSFLGGGNNDTVYVLGGYGATAASYVANVHIDGNLFYNTENVDTSIEINGVGGFTIDHNIFHYTTTGVGNTCLIRSDVSNGSFSNNSIMSESTDTTKPSVALLAFNNGEHQDNIVLNGNVFQTSTGTTVGLIKILKGSRRVTVSNNIFMSSGTTSSHGLDVGEATDVQILGNTFNNIASPIVISAGTAPSTARITIKNNKFDNCGGSGTGHIATTGGTIALTDLQIEGNTVTNPKSTAGGAVFASISASANTQNTLQWNQVYGSLTVTDTPTKFQYIWNNIGYDLLQNSNVARSSPHTMVANVATSISTITVTAGDYLITGACGWRTAANTTEILCGINTTANAFAGGDAFANFGNTGTGTIIDDVALLAGAKDVTVSLPGSRLSTSTTQTFYLISQSDAANNTYGFIDAIPIGNH